jgi:hypothetical protein
MKISKSKLRQIIKEELSRVLLESLDPEKVSLARQDAALDAKDAGDRGDRWEFNEPEYLDVYLEAYQEAMETIDREMS